MIDYVFENNGSIQYDVNGPKIHFYGKNYVTNTKDYVIIKSIYYNDLLLNELFQYSTMTTDNEDYKELKNVNYVSFNGTWELKFTEDDIKQILKKKLT